MATKADTGLHFRGDINGLRAWAVTAVILYHFGVSGFSGGFVGVDVFFVISGFLMTGIIVSGLEIAGWAGFSVWKFYLARARRILPALIALCAMLLTLGWWVLLPIDFKALGTHAVFSLAFLSNIKFWREAGYFDATSHEKWLLHTWSLSVEWQFYLLLPLALLAVWKWHPGRRPIIVLMTTGLLVTFALSVLGTALWPTATFYLLHTRAWEMLAGGLVYLLAHRWILTAQQRTAIEVVALLLVVGSIAGFDATSPWPGWRAIVPVAGTVGVLLSARANSYWTGNRVTQWMGTRSYSLYLWHWPLVVALTYLDLKAAPVAIAAALGLTVLLGHLSYHLVESPARTHLGRLRLGWGAAALMCATMVVASAGSWVRMKEGVLGRFSPEIETTSQEALNRNPRLAVCHQETGTMSPSCIFGGTQRRAIVLGDSHANAVVTSVAAAAPRPDDGVMEWSYSGCPVMQDVHSQVYKAADWQCAAFFDWTIQELKNVSRDVAVIIVLRHAQYAVGLNENSGQENVPAIYFSRRYATSEPSLREEYAQHLITSSCKLAQNHPVYLVRPIPEMGINVPKTMARAMALGRYREVSISLTEYHQRNAFIWAAQDAARDRCGVNILDPLPYLCHDGICYGSKDGRPLYYDDDHLSEYGNKLLVPMFATIFQKE